MQKSRDDRIHAHLETEFHPTQLQVVDQSHLHAGHAGARPGGETHYKIIIRAACFDGLSRVAIQRKIMQALRTEFETGLHALSIDAQSL